MSGRKFVLAPNPFKGTMLPDEISQIMARALGLVFPGCECIRIPMADGGEGTTRALCESLGGELRHTVVQGPFGRAKSATYGILPGGVGVVEAAEACGLSLAKPNLDPEITTSYGLGELIRACIQDGCRAVLVGLGGTATNDGGCGAAAALSAVFRDREGKSFVPVGGTLKDIVSIDVTGLRATLKGERIIGMCDVFAPLTGPTGAAFVYGPQKGAGPEKVKRLDAGLAHLADQIEKDLGIDERNVKGAGAAGGLGYGLRCLLGGELKGGAQAVLDYADFDKLAKGADLVFTGEGKVDYQTLQGKGVLGVAQKAKKLDIPVVVVAGDVGVGYEPLYDNGVTAVFSINRVAIPRVEAKLRAREDLFSTMVEIGRLIKGLWRD